ncbi:MAG: lactonase family protein [Opitutaceae bacterium]
MITPSPAPVHRLFIGTYTKKESRGIYSLQLDESTGALTKPVLAAETGNPSFLALSPDRNFLYAVNDSPTLAVAFSIASGEQPRLKQRGIAPQTISPAPSHIAVDRTGHILLVAHFNGAFIAALPIEADGSVGKPGITRHVGHGFDPVRQASPHPHSATISPDNRFALVCDLGLDRILSYPLDPRAAQATAAPPRFSTVAPGAGPRHSSFSPDGRHLYVINEMGGTITTFLYHPTNGALAELGSTSTLPGDFTGQNTTAEVRVHPNGKFVYGSNRGHDSIAVFARDQITGLLSRLAIVPCGGQHPRHFSISPPGTWLVCANMNSDSLTVFRIDPETGLLTRVPESAHVSMPVCVLFYD